MTRAVIRVELPSGYLEKWNTPASAVAFERGNLCSIILASRWATWVEYSHSARTRQ